MLALAPLFLGFASTPGHTCGPNHGNGCECIGNNGVSDGTKFNMDIGNSCRPWDGMESYCMAYEYDTLADGEANGIS